MKYLQYCTYIWFEVGDFKLLVTAYKYYKFIFMY